MARGPTVILAAVVLLSGANSALADERQDVRQEIEQTESSIRAGQAQQRSLAEQARAVRDQVDSLRLRAAVAAREAQQEEAALSAVEARLAALRGEDQAFRRRLGWMRDSMARSIAALVRMERHSTAALLTAAGTILDAARGGRLLAAALPALRADADEISKLLAAAGKVRGQLTAAQRRHFEVAAALSARQTTLRALLRERFKSEQRLRQAGAVEGKRLAALALKAGDLRALMQRLELEERQRREQRERLARQQRITAQQAAAKAAEEAALAVAQQAAQKAARLVERRAEQRRRKLAADMARALAAPKAKAGGNKSDWRTQPRRRLAMAPGRLPFSKLRGRLRLPAEGKQVGKYGESTGFGPRAQGITLQTRKGAQVVVPYDGRVVFAGPFRDYGLILIISHGEGYHTLLAGLSALQAVVGQTLLTGEPVGRMGGDGKRSLYIELRRKGVAINPNPWWSSSRERANG